MTPSPSPSGVPLSAQGVHLETYVAQTAALLGLSIPDDQIPAVVENFGQVQAIAQGVLDFPLPDQLDPAPRFDP